MLFFLPTQPELLKDKEDVLFNLGFTVLVTQWRSDTSSQKLMIAHCIQLSNSMSSDIMLVVQNLMSSRYLRRRNQQTLQIRVPPPNSQLLQLTNNYS